MEPGVSGVTLGPSVYRRAFENAGVPVMMMDTTGEVEAANDAALAFSGHDRESLIGTSVTRLLAERTTTEEIAEAMVAGREWHGDLKLRTAEGRTVHGQGSVAPVPGVDDSSVDAGTGPDADEAGSRDGPDQVANADGGTDTVSGSPCGYLAAFVDARQKRQYETAAEVLNRLLRHDLKNDLNVVYGYLQQARA
ncbi:MAG: PAS sensor histidine kinase, partial [halophilic archaeon J07HB67]